MTNELFSGDRDYWPANACLDWSPDRMPLYIEGYREAAETLVHHVIETKTNQDILVFPIAFLYRQYIELQLKHIISESKIFLEEDAKFPEHHKIHDLWDTAKLLMDKIIKDHDQSIIEYITKEDTKTIKKIISKFAMADPDSFAFRYPKDKKGKKNLDGIKYINIKKLHDQMKILKEKLDKYYQCISYLREFQDDMYAEYGP